jgi:argininosuccinate lyase
MDTSIPVGYLGADTAVGTGPAPELVEAGYQLELADAPLLHRGMGLADLAHVLTLLEVGVVPRAQAALLLGHVLDVLTIPAEDFPYDPVYGDAYNSREREFTRRVGDVAGWLHTGRTRREAGRTAFRLALRGRLLDLHDAVCRLARELTDKSREHATTVWADSTYLQPAQPSTFGHYLGAFAEEAVRHLRRLQDAYAWVDRSPAGVGGVGGGSIALDRAVLADRLGFAAIGAHSRDIMWATDGLVDVVTAAVQTSTTVDRFAEDFEIFASPRFGYLKLDGSLCRASVLMPQKRNPYALAVIRSGAGTLVGRATGLMVTQRTPSARTDNWLHAYGEVSGSVALAERIVRLGAEVVRTLVVDVDQLAASSVEGFVSATDLAERLVQRCHIDYRTAYRVVGRAVRDLVDQGGDAFTADSLARSAASVMCTDLDVDWDQLAASISPQDLIARRTGLGASAPDAVCAHANSVQAALHSATRWGDSRSAHAAQSEKRLIDEAATVADLSSAS